MANQVTVTLSEDVYRRTQRFARMIGQSLDEIVAENLANIPDMPETSPVSTLSDEEVLALANLQMDADEDTRHSELLERQQAGLLTDSERIELRQLTQLYRILLLRKSQAMREAVQRGLKV